MLDSDGQKFIGNMCCLEPNPDKESRKTAKTLCTYTNSKRIFFHLHNVRLLDVHCAVAVKITTQKVIWAGIIGNWGRYSEKFDGMHKETLNWNLHIKKERRIKRKKREKNTFENGFIYYAGDTCAQNAHKHTSRTTRQWAHFTYAIYTISVFRGILLLISSLKWLFWIFLFGQSFGRRTRSAVFRFDQSSMRVWCITWLGSNICIRNFDELCNARLVWIDRWCLILHMRHESFFPKRVPGKARNRAWLPFIPFERSFDWMIHR